MSGNNGLDILRAAVVGALDDNYQGKQAQAVVTVTSVQRNGAGGVETVTGTIDGAGAFTVPMKGREAGVGDQLLVAYPKGSPVGAELAYLRHSSSDNPAAGLLQIDPDLPPPTFAPTWHSTALVATPGSITARATIYLVAVEERFRPSGYVVSFRVDAGLGYGEWGDLRVPHLGGTQECALGSDFAPGASIDVKLRAEYNWAASASVASETRTFTAALDNATPGNATGLAVGTGTPGTLILQATGSVDATIFAGWRYEIATSSGGAGLQTSAPLPGEWTPQGLAAGNYYVAVRPVSKSGTLGGRFPGSGFAGPYAVTGAFAPDTTPPPTWAAPTLSIVRNQPATGGETAVLTVTLPGGYSYPADYQQTIVRFANGALYFERTLRQGLTSLTETVPFGTTSVTLQGEDTSGNRGTASPAATATLTATGVPGAAPTVTTATVALAIVAQWTAVTSALAYEVQRATSGAGAGAVTIATTDTRQWVDTLTTPTIIQPTYWYRVRAVNLQGSGPYSGWVSGTAGLVDAQNLRLNSVTANQMAANSIAANSIQAGAVTASKMEADMITSTVIRTGGSGIDRMELHGQIGGDTNANSLIAVNAAGQVTMKLTGTGLDFRNAAGTAALSSGIDGGGVGYLQSAGGFGIRGDYTNLDLSNLQYMVWRYSQFDGLLTTFGHEAYLTRLRTAANVSVGIGLIGLSTVNGGPPYGSLKFYVGDTLDPLNPTDNMPTVYVQLSGGSVYATANLQAAGALFLGNSGKSLKWNASASAYDFDAPIRATTTGAAQALKMYHDGTNARLDWSAGVLALGSNSNPGGYVVAGNGAGGYGPMGASAFNVLSSETVKANIRDLPSMAAALRLFRPRQFQRLGQPAKSRDEFGVVAEEIEAVAPNAVVELPGLPLREPTEKEPEPPTGPAQKGVNPLALLSIVIKGVQEYMDTTDAALAELRGEIAALKRARA